MVQGTAKVRVTLELTNVGAWDGDATVAQVQKQAAETATHLVQQLLGGQPDIRIREVEVQQVLTDAAK